MAALRISSVVTPPRAAVEVDAPRVECAPKMEESIPERSNIILSHLAMVLEVTALWGLTKDTNSFDSSLRNDLVLSRYRLSMLTGQSVEFDGKEGKKILLLVCLDETVSPVNWVQMLPHQKTISF